MSNKTVIYIDDDAVDSNHPYNTRMSIILAALYTLWIALIAAMGWAFYTRVWRPRRAAGWQRGTGSAAGRGWAWPKWVTRGRGRERTGQGAEGRQGLEDTRYAGYELESRPVVV
ncbi:hypothetical protein EDC01DRAFT_779973 [Geopyxis carbonaria]|nr:hypothetical protein EDC01DRAFT_779973 [Geopyxis carbonaria]